MSAPDKHSQAPADLEPNATVERDRQLTAVEGLRPWCDNCGRNHSIHSRCSVHAEAIGEPAPERRSGVEVRIEVTSFESGIKLTRTYLIAASVWQVARWSSGIGRTRLMEMTLDEMTRSVLGEVHKL